VPRIHAGGYLLLLQCAKINLAKTVTSMVHPHSAV
jgi:hypothetical protein